MPYKRLLTPLQADSFAITTIFICLSLALVAKGYFVFLAQTSIYLLIAEALIFLAGMALINLISHLSIRWLKILLETLFSLLALLYMLTTLIAVYNFSLTGTIPRLEQLHGLTFDMLAPSLIPLVMGQKYTLLAIIVITTLVFIFTRRIARLAYFHICVISADILFLLALLAFYQHNGFSSTNENTWQPLAWQVFHSDISDLEATRDDYQGFIQYYYQRLASSKGMASRYQGIFQQLAGKNIILLSMESTRAKDFALYGNQTKMPFVRQLAKHSIIFRHMYSQDIRSTKAYPALDMGQFSLLAWANYSNDLTMLNHPQGLIPTLKRLGYHTSAFVNGDADYDAHKDYQINRGYDEVYYQGDMNPAGYICNDVKMLDFIAHKLQQQQGRFYMMLWPIASHHPYTRAFWNDKKKWLAKHPEGIKHGSPDDHRRYLTSLEEMDDFIHHLVTILKKQGKYDNTVLIAVGDHGEAFGEHEKRNYFHGNNLYEESIHVAAFIHNPHIPGTIYEPRYLPHRDLAASILHLASGGKQAILNDARSIFNHYQYDLPLYLYNSWSRVRGIIYRGYKLRISIKGTFFNRMQNITDYDENTKDAELRKLDNVMDPEYIRLKHLLSQWYNGMRYFSFMMLGDAMRAEARHYIDMQVDLLNNNMLPRLALIKTRADFAALEKEYYQKLYQISPQAAKAWRQKWTEDARQQFLQKYHIVFTRE